MTASLKFLFLLLLTLGSTPQARAVILYGTDDPAANTTAPSGSLANSGWQLQGQWGQFLGTPIAPHFFVTAKHVGGSVGQIFYFQNVAYTATAEFADSSTDLRIWQVGETFPSYAPLYQGSDEVGRQLVVIGRGTQRGPGVKFHRTLRGWSWGIQDGVQRWGQNVVSEVVSGGTDNDLLYATFDQPRAGRRTQASQNEAHSLPVIPAAGSSSTRTVSGGWLALAMRSMGRFTLRPPTQTSSMRHFSMPGISTIMTARITSSSVAPRVSQPGSIPLGSRHG